MSIVFQGFLCKCEKKNLKTILEGLPSSLHLAIGELNPSLYTLFRNARLFSQELDAIAADVSKHLGATLMIYWDDSVDYRRSDLYKNGILEKSFTNEDEIWVPLDDSSIPMIDAPKLKLSEVLVQELEDDHEFEIIENAIMLGLKKFGISNWNEVFNFIRQGQPS